MFDPGRGARHIQGPHLSWHDMSFWQLKLSMKAIAQYGILRMEGPYKIKLSVVLFSSSPHLLPVDFSFPLIESYFFLFRLFNDTRSQARSLFSSCSPAALSFSSWHLFSSLMQPLCVMVVVAHVVLIHQYLHPLFLPQQRQQLMTVWTYP